jgi:hypothetical protein
MKGVFMKPAQDILPHSDFTQLHPRLWTLEGKLPHHNPLPRTMTVFKMNDGGLWIHSAIALNDETQKKLESFGKPKYVVVPNPDHRLDAHFYKETYPSIQVVCPEAAIKKVEEVISVDAACEVAFANSEIEVIDMPGAKSTELAYEIQLGDQIALVMTDLLVNLPKVKGVGGLILKAIGRIGFFRSPPISKMLFLEHKHAFRNWLVTESNKPELKIVTMAHGAAVTNGVSDLLKRAAYQV